jgi:hypothetical protein
LSAVCVVDLSAVPSVGLAVLVSRITLAEYAKADQPSFVPFVAKQNLCDLSAEGGISEICG